MLQRAWGVGLWVLVAVGGAYLLTGRLRGVVGDDAGVDLTFFIEAARAVRAGGSPYDEPGYVYTPLIALVLAPVAYWSDLRIAWDALSLAALVLAASVVSFQATAAAGWRRPATLGCALLTGLSFWPTVHVLFLGQVDLLLLGVIACLSLVLARPVLAGSAIGLLGLMKTWPGALLLLLLIRGGHRPRSVLRGAGFGVFALVGMVLAVDGPAGFVRFLRRTLAASDQDLPSFSAWGLGEILFTDRLNEPIVESHIWQMATTVVSLLLVLSLAILVFRRSPGFHRLWLGLGVLVLILPISHLAYAVLLLPLLWLAVAHALDKADAKSIALAVLCLAWWVLVRRSWPVDAATVWWQAAMVPLCNFALVTASAVVLAGEASSQRS